MSEITASEQIRLDIIKKVNYDTAAAKLAIDWVPAISPRRWIWRGRCVTPSKRSPTSS